MSEPRETIIIVGAGIVGSALAHFLSSSPSPTTPRTITLIDRSFGPLLGSTGHAPGFVGQFNDSKVLTKLAIDSVSEYTKIPGGFDTVGGLEIAFQPAGCERLKARCAAAAQLGLPAEMLSLSEAHTLAPELVRDNSSDSAPGTAVFFPTDGTADACAITSFYQASAKKSGVHFLQSSVEKLSLTSDGRIKGVQVVDSGSRTHLDADKVIFTTGIWALDLCRDLPCPVPVIPVGHPYMHARTRTPLSPREKPLPFVRWPEHHVYARDHGARYGIGSYDHPPVGCAPNQEDGTAIGVWIPDFRQTLESARGMLPPETAAEFEEDGSEKKKKTRSRSFNGIFSMTPDNMPLAGAVRSVPGLHMAVAVWVTHAAGTAKFLTGVIGGEEVDRETLEALEPERFAGRDFATLEEESLCGYNSIYKTVAK